MITTPVWGAMKRKIQSEMFDWPIISHVYVTKECLIGPTHQPLSTAIVFFSAFLEAMCNHRIIVLLTTKSLKMKPNLVI